MSTDAVAILAYHAIEPGPGPICLPRRTFERQVGALHDAGCEALSMSQVADHLRSGRPFPDRAIALTFDDAYASVHATALPLLDSLGWIATVLPVTGELGGHNRWDTERGAFPELRLVDRSRLLELHAAGWEIGGHTHTHRSLPAVSPDALGRELHESAAILEDLCQQPIRTFAYPFGHHDPKVRTMAAQRYDVCLAIGARRARTGASLDRLDRVDAWYLQRPWHLDHLHDRAGDAYLGLRRLGRVAGNVLRRGSGGPVAPT